MLYDVEFSELFDSKRQAVVCYLSLERRYMALIKRRKELLDAEVAEGEKLIDWFMRHITP